MPAFVTIESRPTFRDLQGRFTRGTDALIAEKREQMRDLGRKYVMYAKEEAPEGKTGRFKESIRYRTDEHGSEITLRAYSAQPLGTFIIGGTKAHKIQAKSSGGALYFFWPRVGMYTVVPRSDGFKTHEAGGKLWIGKGYVDHPGTKPNPFHQRAYESLRPEIQAALRKISTRFTESVKGIG